MSFFSGKFKMNLKFCFVVVTSLGRNREIFVFCIEYSFAGRSSHRRCFVKKGALKNFSNFTGKCLCWNLFLIKLQASWPATLLKRDSNASFFSLWNREILKSICFDEHLFYRTPQFQPLLNPSQVNVHFLYPGKIPENLWFSDIFRRYKKGALTWNWLNNLTNFPENPNGFRL